MLDRIRWQWWSTVSSIQHRLMLVPARTLDIVQQRTGRTGMHARSQPMTTSKHAQMHKCMHRHTNACADIQMRVRHTNACADIQMRVWTYKCVCRHTNVCVDIQMRVWTYKCVCRHTTACTHVQVHTNIPAQTCRYLLPTPTPYEFTYPLQGHGVPSLTVVSGASLCGQLKQLFSLEPI